MKPIAKAAFAAAVGVAALGTIASGVATAAPATYNQPAATSAVQQVQGQAHVSTANFTGGSAVSSIPKSVTASFNINGAPAPQDLLRCENFVNTSAGGYWVRYTNEGGYIGWTNEGCWNLGQVIQVP